MVGIKMDMPNTCRECCFCVWDSDYNYFNCVALDDDVFERNKKRRDDCPLVELVGNAEQLESEDEK